MPDDYKLKTRRNEEQHEHNVTVISKMQPASENLKNKKVNCAQQNIAEM